MREPTGVGVEILISLLCSISCSLAQSPVARGYQPPPVPTVDRVNTVFEDPRQAYRARTLQRDPTVHPLFHPPAPRPEFPHEDGPERPRPVSHAPGARPNNSFSRGGRPPASVPFNGHPNGPAAPLQNPHWNRPLSGGPEALRQNPVQRNSNVFAPPPVFHNEIPREWNRERQPTIHRQTLLRHQNRRMDPRFNVPTQMSGTMKNSRVDEPVNIFIHLFLTPKNGSSSEKSVVPVEIELPLGRGSHSRPILIEKEIDRDTLEFLRNGKSPTEEESPTNVVQVKAMVGSSDRRIDRQLHAAVDKELDRAIPMVLEKMDVPGDDNDMDEGLRSELEKALVDEISKHLGDTIDQMDSGISADELEKIIEEGFEELEKSGTSPSPKQAATSPPLPLPSLPSEKTTISLPTHPPTQPTTKIPSPPSTAPRSTPSPTTAHPTLRTESPSPSTERQSPSPSTSPSTPRPQKTTIPRIDEDMESVFEGTEETLPPTATSPPPPHRPSVTPPPTMRTTSERTSSTTSIGKSTKVETDFSEDMLHEMEEAEETAATPITIPPRPSTGRPETTTTTPTSSTTTTEATATVTSETITIHERPVTEEVPSGSTTESEKSEETASSEDTVPPPHRPPITLPPHVWTTEWTTEKSQEVETATTRVPIRIPSTSPLPPTHRPSAPTTTPTSEATTKRTSAIDMVPLPVEHCPTPNDEKDVNRTDVVFLIDSSSSFNERKFRNSIRLIQNTVKRFRNIGPKGIQVSLVQFNLEPYLEFSLRRHICKEYLLDDIGDTEYMRGQTMLGKAIDKVKKFAFTRTRGDREDADNVIVIVTDGMSDDRVQQPLQIAKDNGAKVLVIATLEADPNTLMDLAGDMDNVFMIGTAESRLPLAEKLARKIVGVERADVLSDKGAPSRPPALQPSTTEVTATFAPTFAPNSQFSTIATTEATRSPFAGSKSPPNRQQEVEPTLEPSENNGYDFAPPAPPPNRQPGGEAEELPFVTTDISGVNEVTERPSQSTDQPKLAVSTPSISGNGGTNPFGRENGKESAEEGESPPHLTHITPMSRDTHGVLILQCVSDGFKVRLNLPSDFAGTVLVKGHEDNGDCSQEIPHVSSTVNRTIDFFVDNEKCGITKMKSNLPRGLNSSVILNLMHNPSIITADDRAYILNCFVAQPDDVEIGADLSVNPHQLMIGETISLSSVPPVCVYSIRKGSPTGDVTGRAVLGETIYHTWQCSGAEDSNDVYGMHVHDCYASSDIERKYPIVDKNGCSADIGVLSDPIYSNDKLAAFSESKAFGFEEVESLKFVCKVSLCTRDGDGCEGVTPPRCGNSSDLLPRRTLHLEESAIEGALTSALRTQVSVSSSAPSPLRTYLSDLIASKMVWMVTLIAIVAILGTAVVSRISRINRNNDIESGYANSDDMSTRSRTSTISNPSADPRMRDFIQNFDRDRYI